MSCQSKQRAAGSSSVDAVEVEVVWWAAQLVMLIATQLALPLNPNPHVISSQPNLFPNQIHFENGLAVYGLAIYWEITYSNCLHKDTIPQIILFQDTY